MVFLFEGNIYNKLNGKLQAGHQPDEQRAEFFLIQIWGVRDVASYTGYAIGTLYNLVSRNLIPHRKKRGKLYFVPSEIQNWIEEGDL